MRDERRDAIYEALSRLTPPQLHRILATPPGEMVVDSYAYEADSGRY